jgi:preprotein translocase subunit SecE
MRSELKKVVWPAPDKVAKNTGTVILYSVLIGACIWVFDSVAALFIKTLLGLFSA